MDSFSQKDVKRFKCRFCPLTSARMYNIQIHERRIHKDAQDQNIKKQSIVPMDESNMEDDSEEESHTENNTNEEHEDKFTEKYRKMLDMDNT